MPIGGSSDEGYGSEIEQVLIAYLQSHPHAADTLDGIVAWWLPRQRYEIGRARIAGVLSAMVQAGTLRREALPDGEALYALPANERSVRARG